MTSSRPLPGRSLADLRPDVAGQWHPTKNGSLTPAMVTAGSGKKVWWLGPCGHEWDAPLTSRTIKNSGCPICANKRVASGINDLATTNSELALEWHPTKNRDLTTEMVTGGSSKRVWWLAKCGHDWDASISDRVIYSTGCPFCFGNIKMLVGVNDLATADPELAKEWHPTKNGSLSPTDVKQFSSKKVWWLGACGHEWQSTIAHRSGGRNCPFCVGKRVLPRFNDLATTDPDIAAQWHPTKNGDLTPEMVGRGSDKKVWWLSHGHEWVSTISSRAISKQGCAICNSAQVQVGVNDLASTLPDIAKKWHPARNGEVNPAMVTRGSGKRYWWLGECGHSWKASVSHLSAGRGCAICSGSQIEAGINDLESQYPDFAAQWHPTKNEGLTPQQVTSSSGKKVWWLCENGHEWQAKISGRQYGARGCPGCAQSGFSPTRYGWLYFLHHSLWNMQQIGISNVPESRLAQHRRLGWQVNEVRGPMDGALAQALEQEALKALRRRGASLGVPTSSGGFDGHTEAWPTDSLEVKSFRQLLDWVYSDDTQISSEEHLEAWTIPEKGPSQPRAVAKCKIEGCGKKHHGYGLCKLHYRRWIKSGDTGPVSTLKVPNGTYKNSTCSVDGCERTPVGRGLCTMHHRRLLATGDVGMAESSVSHPNERICKVEGCEKPWYAKKMCEVHYRRFVSNGDPTVTRTGGKPKSYCSIDNCDKPAFGHGLCNMHYKRFRKHGDPHKRMPS